MFIFLIRHAEGSGSREKWQTPDTPLSDTGAKQSENLTTLSRFKKVDLILSSKWKRALETAKIVSKLLDKKLLETDGIQEREQHSEIYGADRQSDISKRYNDENIKNYNDLDWKFENKEEFKEQLGGFEAGGNCRTEKGKTNGFIWFGGWGDPFERLQPLKNKYYSGGNAFLKSILPIQLKTGSKPLLEFLNFIGKM